MKRKAKLEVSFTRSLTYDYIDDKTGEYVKSTAQEDGRFRFYLRTFKEWFYPCENCQKTLFQKTYGSESLYLGNKSYEPAIELSRDWVIDESSWKEVERRSGTLDDFKKIYGSDGEKYWDNWQKELKDKAKETH